MRGYEYWCMCPSATLCIFVFAAVYMDETVYMDEGVCIVVYDGVYICEWV